MNDFEIKLTHLMGDQGQLVILGNIELLKSMQDLLLTQFNKPDPAFPAGPSDALAKAREIIYGDREKTYGTPGFNLKSISDFWTVYIQRKQPSATLLELSPLDVCQMMILLKTARLINSPDHLDSIIDQIGYAALHDRILPRD